MKKQTRMALLPAGIVLFLGASAVLVFQNCSNVKFAQSKDALPSALGQTAKSCLDTGGVEHQSSSEWNETADRVEDVSCADSPTSKQGYLDTTRFVCDDGTVNNMGTLSQLVQPMSSCPAPLLSAGASPTKVPNGGSTNLLVNSQAVHDVKYSCKSVANSSEMFHGNLALGTVTQALSPIVEDLSCSVTAQTSTAPITKSLDLSVDCESSGKIKDPATHMCVEFKCKSFTVITPNATTGLIDVPARTDAGICYTVKLMSAIANSPSTLNATHDDQVTSANHNGGGTWNPWVMGRSNVEFIMRAGGGARQVKLSGDGRAMSPILVDNFLISGLAKKSVGLASNNAYRAYGTIDSTVDGTNIIFRNMQKLALSKFGTGGTATVNALDLTTQVSTEENYLMDVRALDCGGSRELSDIYLLFQ